MATTSSPSATWPAGANGATGQVGTVDLQQGEVVADVQGDELRLRRLGVPREADPDLGGVRDDVGIREDLTVG